MTSFEQHGFLAEDELGVSKALSSRYSTSIDLCKDLNSYLQSYQYKLTIHNQDHVEVLSATLYAQFLSTSQATLLLLFKGMGSQTRMLIRCMLESLFPLAAVAENRESAKKFLLSSSYIERRKKLNAFIAFSQKTESCLDTLKENKKFLEETNAEIKKHNIEKYSVYNCAEDSGLSDWYETLYRYTSDDVHSAVSSLQERLSLCPEGVIKFIKNEPEVEDLDELFATIANCQLKALEATSTVFKDDKSQQIEVFKSRIENLK